MSRIDERLEAMKVDASEMTTEQKFTAATGLTHYDESTASNEWYVPAGAANVPAELTENNQEQAEPQGEQGQQGAQGTSEPQEQGEPQEEPITVTPEEVAAHITDTPTEEDLAKYDLDGDGDIDEDDVTKASEIEIETEP